LNLLHWPHHSFDQYRVMHDQREQRQSSRIGFVITTQQPIGARSTSLDNYQETER
jgi:hypothetical protein